MKLKSHFLFNRQQRSGILLLVLLLVGLLSVYFFVDFSEEEVLDTTSSEIVELQKELDSLERIAFEAKKPKIYLFNPNYITDYKGYALGMSNEEIDRLLQYRKEGKWINSAEDFKTVTEVSDSLLSEISPYFKFPEWVSKTKSSSKTKYKKGFAEKTFAQKSDLNTVTEAQLQEVSGIGEVLSKRIITYRSKLGGFSDDFQLYEVYGIEAAVVQRALNEFTVKSPKPISKININTASASDIATIPGVSFELAKEIWEYRVLRQKVEDLTDLSKIEGMTERKLRLIQLYLSTD